MRESRKREAGSSAGPEEYLVANDSSESLLCVSIPGHPMQTCCRRDKATHGELEPKEIDGIVEQLKMVRQGYL